MTQKLLEVIVDRVSYIHYPFQFQKNKKATIWALIDSSSEVNAMAPAYAATLGLKVYQTNIGAQKIDGLLFKTFRLVIASFQVEDNLGRAQFFQGSTLLADTGMKLILEMSFLTLSNANI